MKKKKKNNLNNLYMHANIHVLYVQTCVCVCEAWDLTKG